MQKFSFLLILFLCSACAKSDKDETPNPASTSVQINRMEITLSEGTNMAAVPGPDGQEVVIDLQGRLWIVPIDGGEAVAITDPLTEARQPDWSKANGRICFQGYRDGNWQLYSVRPNGDDLQQHTSGRFDYREPVWSPDGKHLLCSSDRGGNYDIWQLTLADGTFQQYTSESTEDYGPCYAPDGQHIAYVAKTGDTHSLRSYQISSQQDRGHYESSHKIFGPQFTPDSEALTFVEISRNTSSLRQISLNSLSANAKQLSESGLDIFPFRAHWLDEQALLYTADGRIWRKPSPLQTDESDSPAQPLDFRASVSVERAIYPRKQRDFDETGAQQAKGIYAPVLSPDGQQVAFVGLQDLYVQHVNGMLEQLTDDAAVELCPAWSPDGQQIAYLSDKDGQWAVWLADLRQPKKAHQKKGAIVGSPNGLAWSPDGQHLAYSVGFGPRLGQLWLMELATGETQKDRKSVV